MWYLNDILIPVGDKVFKVDTDFRSVMPIVEHNGDVLSLLPDDYFDTLMSNYGVDLMDYKMELDKVTIVSNLFLKNEFPAPDNDIENAPKTVSFDKDYSFIIPSFQQQYNIDLLNIEFLDFRQFQMLLSGLKQSIYNDILNIRSAKLTGSEKEQSEMLKLKLQYDVNGIEEVKEQRDWLKALEQIRGDNDV